MNPESHVPAYLQRPIRFALWLGFAVLFYNSGLGLTTWILQPELASDIDRLFGVLFPPLLVAFFYVNRRLGCYGSGGCAVPREASRVVPPGH